MLIPAGNQTVNASLPAYNGWFYNVSIAAQTSIGVGLPATLSFEIGVAPRNPPSAVDFGVVSVNPDQTAEFTIAWSTNYADTGINGVAKYFFNLPTFLF